jgi:hypothetical protein
MGTCVFFAIEHAVERGRFGRPKQLAAEAAGWSGWNDVTTVHGS